MVVVPEAQWNDYEEWVENTENISWILIFSPTSSIDVLQLAAHQVQVRAQQVVETTENAQVQVQVQQVVETTENVSLFYTWQRFR
jgi:hypothetical protein